MRVFVIAGEPSGDALGGALLEGLHQLCPRLEIEGVGGPLMIAQGLRSNFDMSELSVMGLAEILPKYVHLRRRLDQTVRAVLAQEPDVLITIDSPDFCLRVARRVRQAKPGIRTVHYVAPTVWAWRAGRAEKMARFIDHVLALFPFEPEVMREAGMRCDFVGHPVVSQPQASEADIARFRADHQIGDTPCLLVLPGSRLSEVTRLTPIFGAVLGKVMKERPDLQVLLPAAAPVAEAVRGLTQAWPVRPVVLDGRAAEATAEKRAAFGAARAALAASGTVSLELAAAGTPMVIAYDMNWLSRQILKRMIRVDTVTLVNLVSETRAVPEFLGEGCRPDRIVPSLLDVLARPEEQAEALALTMARLGKGGDAPGLRAARAVVHALS